MPQQAKGSSIAWKTPILRSVHKETGGPSGWQVVKGSPETIEDAFQAKP